MIQHPWRRGLLLAVVLSPLPLLLPPAAPAEIRNADSPQVLRAQAEQFEKAGAWAAAAEKYGELWRLDRNQNTVRERYWHCLRRLYQVVRLRDPSYQSEVLTLKYPQAVRLYEIVLYNLLHNGLDKNRVSPGSLFRMGLSEFGFALTSAEFCLDHLHGQKPEQVRAFRTRLQTQFADRPIATFEEAVETMRDVVMKTANQYPDINPTTVVMEFLCGACLAVDDYTTYLTPRQVRELCTTLQGQPAGYGIKENDQDHKPTVEHAVLGNVGYLKIHCFLASTLQEFDTHLAEVLEADCKALILDLRGNPGGLLDVSIEIARRFLPEGIVVSIQQHDAKSRRVYRADNPNALALPLVVLVDGDTASAAEVLAGALKDNRRARLVGKTTYGKGSIMGRMPLPGEGELRLPATTAPSGASGAILLTIARCYSPSGQSYSDRGVEPDIPADTALQLDHAQLEAQRLLPG
jgi:C-terminal processing protease CtpA/Prc